MKDVIVGKIYFLLVRIKIKHMELSIIRRETTGTGMCSYMIHFDIGVGQILTRLLQPLMFTTKAKQSPSLKSWMVLPCAVSIS
jgi:hypothetical protein